MASLRKYLMWHIELIGGPQDGRQFHMYGFDDPPDVVCYGTAEYAIEYRQFPVLEEGELVDVDNEPIYVFAGVK